MRPDRPISPQAMAIHRITEAMVADKPWIEDVIPHYYGSEWYVAHNASFDRRVLPEMPGEWICTMKLARRLWPGIKYSNMALYKTRKLNVQTPPGLHHHRALYDCYITAALLIDIMNTSGWTAEQMARYHRTSVVDDDLHLWQIPWQSGFRRCRTRSGLSALVI